MHSIRPHRLLRPKNFEEMMDRAINREHILVKKLKSKAPVIETYIQEVKADEDLGFVPKNDRYFLGKLDMSEGVNDDSFIPLPTGIRKIPHMMGSLVTRQYFPRGFAYMMFVDESNFDRAHYNFLYVRREFLGDVRCIVVDVSPQKKAGHDLFEGRLWIEDEGYNIVRFNGVYVPIRDHRPPTRFLARERRTGTLAPVLHLHAESVSRTGSVEIARLPRANSPVESKRKKTSRKRHLQPDC